MMNTQSSNTNVLLLIIPNPSSTILPHSLFYRIFSSYGEVAKILIFEKARVWKAFIEMGTDQQAKDAQFSLNGTQIADGITMNVYYSTLKSVTFLNNNCGGVDYRQLKQHNVERKKLQLNQSSTLNWEYQAASQPDLQYQQPNQYQQQDFSYSQYQYGSFQNVPEYSTPMNQMMQSFTLQPSFNSSTNIEFKPTESEPSWLGLSGSRYDVQATQRKKLRRQTSLEKIHESPKNFGSGFVTTEKKQLSTAESELMGTGQNISQLIQLINIKEENNKEQQQDVVQLPKDLYNYEQDDEEYLINYQDFDNENDNENNEDDGDNEKYIQKMKRQFSGQQEDEQNDSNMSENWENEGLSPDEENIMKAFASQYVFSLPHVQTGQFNVRKRSLTQQLEQSRVSDLSNQFSTCNISQGAPGLDPPSYGSQQKIEITHDDLIDPLNYVNPQFLIENQPSKVIYIRGLAHPQLSPINIFNLLSNCGNVMVIIFIKSKSSALVQFEKLHQAQNAKDHLNNMPFFGQKLKIFYSNYQQIQFPLPYQSPQTMVLIPSRDQFRFGEGKSISFNPPSQTLHLSNIKFEVTENEQYIRKLFQGIGDIQAIKFMHLNQQKHMALVKLGSLEEAMNGAALLHGKELFGRKINVSFTKSKF